MDWPMRWFRSAKPENKPEPEGQTSGIASDRQVVEARLASKVISGALVAALASGPVAVVGVAAVVWSSSPTDGPVAEASSAVARAERASAGEFATRVVRSWLQADREHSEEWKQLAPSGSSVNLPEVGMQTADAQVASIDRHDQAWSVVVGVTVTDADESASRRYFQVPVTAADHAVAALSLPTPVAGPSEDDSGRLDYGQIVQPGGPVAEVVDGFLQAYLIGEGDVARLSAPGASIRAVKPPPYASVSISEVKARDRDVDTSQAPDEGTDLRVIVTGDAVISDSQQATVSYALTLTARAGRWEVAAIDPVPAWTHTENRREPGPESGTDPEGGPESGAGAESTNKEDP